MQSEGVMEHGWREVAMGQGQPPSGWLDLGSHNVPEGDAAVPGPRAWTVRLACMCLCAGRTAGGVAVSVC